jgi:hypothetical protein
MLNETFVFYNYLESKKPCCDGHGEAKLLYGLPWENDDATDATDATDETDATKLSAGDIPESAGLIWSAVDLEMLLLTSFGHVGALHI